MGGRFINRLDVIGSITCKAEYNFVARELLQHLGNDTRSSISWSELAHQDCVTQAQGSGNRLLIDQALSNTVTQPHWVCEVQHVPSLPSLVRRGVGVGAVPQHAISGTDLCGIPLIEPQVLRSIGLISRQGKALSAMAQEFQRALRLVHTRQLN
ncbi:LysR substrate-binding domain-containing protein [Comamonas testosteroni]|uniref:LysR substrate-binding domain-containing protein n=1 Tax=Comamonas testosteroni TaxID=285 RepID=UPI0039190090